LLFSCERQLEKQLWEPGSPIRYVSKCLEPVCLFVFCSWIKDNQSRCFHGFHLVKTTHLRSYWRETLTPRLYAATLARTAWFRLNHLRASVGRFYCCLYKWGTASSAACEWRRTNCRPCCSPMSNPTTSWIARPDASGRWDNRMAAQHLPRDLVRPSSSQTNWLKKTKQLEPRWEMKCYVYCLTLWTERFKSVPFLWIAGVCSIIWQKMETQWNNVITLCLFSFAIYVHCFYKQTSFEMTACHVAIFFQGFFT